jgi:hypothetical protein
MTENGDAFKDRWPRIGKILRELANSYEGEGRRHDLDTERRRKGLDP